MLGGGYQPTGSDFIVNSAVAGLQSDVTLANLQDGGFVACWTDASGTGGDTSGTGVKAQRFDSAGNKVGAEFLVNTSTANTQDQASIASLGSGFVVTWTDASAVGADPDRQGVKAQIFDQSGAKIGGELLVNTTTKLAQSSSAVTVLDNGSFVISWSDASGTAPDAKGTGIRAQVFSSSGGKLGGEFLVNTTILNSQSSSTLAGLTSGGFVAIWSDSSGQGGDPNASSVKGHIFSNTGVKVGSEFLVNTSTAAAQDQPIITALSSGGFVAAWRDLSGVGDTSGGGIKAQVFDAAGVRVGGEIQANTSELNTQDQPAITAIPGGGFAISWEDNSLLSSDAADFGIKTQIFDDIGNKIGAEFQVNTTTGGNQLVPAITALATGALVVGWTDYSGLGGDTDGGIKARIFTPFAGGISDISLSVAEISEVTVENTIAASLSANGAFNASYTYQIISDSTGGAFRLSGDRLEVQNSGLLDYETDPSASIAVRVTDTFGNSFDKVFSIELTDAQIENRYSARDETLANSTIANNQLSPAIAGLPSGNYALVWADASAQGGDTSGYGIKAQLFDRQGNKIGSEGLVNSQALGNQSGPAVAALSSGGFVATWVDASGVGPDSSSSGIKARILGADGSPVAAEFIVNSTTLNAQSAPSVAGLTTGGFVITWTDASLQGGDASVSSIKAQLFDAAGVTVGSEFLVNTATANRQDTPTVAGLASGGFVVTWADSSAIGGDSSKDGVKGQLFDVSGAKVGGEFLVNTLTSSNQQQEAITSLDNGGFVISWADASGQGADRNNFGIKLQVYDASGVRVGSETLANTVVAGSQLAPTVTSQPGGFAVSWADYSGQGAEVGTAGIKAQLFTNEGARIGAEFAVNNQTLSVQGDPTIAAAGGSLAIAWTDYSGQGGDDSGTSIKLRVFEPLATQGPPPSLVAGSDKFGALEDQPALFTAASLLANDVDANGLPLALTEVTSAFGGIASLDANGDALFTPGSNFSGDALFTYTVTNSSGLSATGRVTVSVAPVNDAPIASNDAVTVAQNGAAIAVAPLLANDIDVDNGDTRVITALSATSVAGVPLTLAGGLITYAPASAFQYLPAGQIATDSFGYTISDQAGATSSATVAVTIVGANDAPVELSLTGSNVDENAANLTSLGTLAARDPDAGDTLRYSLTDNGGGRFAVDPSTGVVAVANGTLLNFEAAASHIIIARATDAAGAFVELPFKVSVNNLPEPKSWTGDGGINNFTAPTNDLWTINGLGGNDQLIGNSSSDTIYGGSGNDIIDGSLGADVAYGGMGNDIFYIENLADRLVENPGEGTDLVYSSVDFSLPDNVENLTLSGGADLSAVGNGTVNTINGNAGSNTIRGGLGGDLLNGDAGNDVLYGDEGQDTLQGGDSNDTLVGGGGADDLAGGSGSDTFVFDMLTTSADRDKIRDFTPGEDIMLLPRSVFETFGSLPDGALAASAFTTSSQANNSLQHVIYQPATGNLYFDPDGLGGVAQIQIGLLSTKPTLTSSSFAVS